MAYRAIRLRRDVPPADATIVVRGAERSLSDDILRRTAEANFEMFGFWALSVFLAPGDDLVRLSHEIVAIRRRRTVRTAQCGDLRGAGFPLLDTTRHSLTSASSWPS